MEKRREKKHADMLKQLSTKSNRTFSLSFRVSPFQPELYLCFHIECAALCAQIFALHETQAQRINTEPCWNAQTPG